MEKETYQTSNDPKLKAVVNDIVKQLADILQITVPMPMIDRTLTKFYDKGLEEMELRFEMNFIRNEPRLDLLKDYVSENIQGFNEEMIERLRKEISQSIMNLESVPKMMERIKKIEDISVDRAKMIARTELNRAENMGHLDGARQSGLDLVKEWSAHIDNRTSQVCKDLNGKKVPIDSKFKWKDQEFDIPPAHVSCRSRVIFIQK